MYASISRVLIIMLRLSFNAVVSARKKYVLISSRKKSGHVLCAVRHQPRRLREEKSSKWLISGPTHN